MDGRTKVSFFMLDFIVLQKYLFEYLVDKTLIATPARIMFDGDTVTHFNLNEEGDCIVISSRILAF